MISDINKYGQFYGGNSLVTFGQNECGEPRLYPNNAYYRFNKLRDEGDWPSNISGIYYGKGDCINCPKSNLKNFGDYSWKDHHSLNAGTNQERSQNNKISDINQFLMSNSKVGFADIHYKFLGPAFQRLIVGYQVFWPMQGYQNPTENFNTNYVYSESMPRANGIISSETAANRTGVGEWPREWDGNTVTPWGAMKRKIMGSYGSPSSSPGSKLNMGAWYWPERNNYFQWYINSNFNGPPKINGFVTGFNKKFPELRIIFDSCSVSNIENRVRVKCPSPGSHIFAGKNLLAGPNLKYRFHPSDFDNEGLVGCFVEYFALMFTDKEKNTLEPVQLGIVEARSEKNFYDVTNTSTFNNLLQEYGLNIQGGSEISGEADIEITGFGWPRGVNINLCSTEYYNSRLDTYMNFFTQVEDNTFPRVWCTEGDSIYSPYFPIFSGINVASGLVHPWSERQGLWTSGLYSDPPFYIGGFLRMADAEYFSTISNNGFQTLSPAGIQNYYLGDTLIERHSRDGQIFFESDFYPIPVVGDGNSFYAFSQGYTGWFCRNAPCPGCPDGYVTDSRGYIDGKWIYFVNSEFGKLLIPHRPLYFIHGYANALLTPFDFEAPGGGKYCGARSYPILNKINECNSPGTDYFSYNGGFSTFMLMESSDFAHWGQLSVVGYLEEGGIET